MVPVAMGALICGWYSVELDRIQRHGYQNRVWFEATGPLGEDGGKAGGSYLPDLHRSDCLRLTSPDWLTLQ